MMLLRSSRLQMFFNIGVIKSFANFTGKNMCCSLFWIKLQARKPATQVLFFSLISPKFLHLCLPSLYLLKVFVYWEIFKIYIALRPKSYKRIFRGISLEEKVRKISNRPRSNILVMNLEKLLVNKCK